MSDAIREVIMDVLCSTRPMTAPQQADAVLAALQSQTAPAVPEGWKLVPIEPTKQQIYAAEFPIDDIVSCRQSSQHAIAEAAYRAMLAAAPQPDHIGDDFQRGFEAGKKSIIDGGRERIRELEDHSPDAGKVVWGVIDRDGQIAYSIAPNQDYREEWAISSCHEHINEAIADNIAGAAEWVVRPLTIGRLRASQQEGGE